MMAFAFTALIDGDDVGVGEAGCAAGFGVESVDLVVAG